MFIFRMLNLALSVFIVRPATVLFTFLLASMVMTGGLDGFSYSFFENIRQVVSLGPAPEGFINLESCADERLEIQIIEEIPKTVNCENLVITQFPMDSLSKKFGEALIWIYLTAAMLGNAVAYLFIGFGGPWKEVIGIGPTKPKNNLSSARSSNQSK
ncbi:hypothetical protein [Vibrio sp. YT-17]|uniref:hypothetical protein n=1 Tax=Vibrio sp. YT-17 TaxID=3074708 RepID=UPI00296445B9|nr:hypothetical protein [Vibrio sp. YT-17]MDW1542433.1 hypothetical protein [Vibrio sp. YT-17]